MQGSREKGCRTHPQEIQDQKIQIKISDQERGDQETIKQGGQDVLPPSGLIRCLIRWEPLALSLHPFGR